MTTLNMTAEEFHGAFEPTGQRAPDGTPVYRPRDVGGCGGCDNGECCGLDRDDDLAGDCCGQGEYGACS